MTEPEQDDLPCEKLDPPPDAERWQGVAEDHARSEMAEATEDDGE